jgi:hypothetical protein
MRTYLTRLRRLEKANGNRCPFCSGQKPTMLRGAEQEAPSCPACGRRLPAVKLIRDSNFFGNADRLPRAEGSPGVRPTP